MLRWMCSLWVEIADKTSLLRGSVARLWMRLKALSGVEEMLVCSREGFDPSISCTIGGKCKRGSLAKRYYADRREWKTPYPGLKDGS